MMSTATTDITESADGPSPTEGIDVACPLILASSSPRRHDLLQAAGVPFRAVPPRIDEPADLEGYASPAQLAEALAFFKARAVADRHPDTWILGADTIVALEGEILGKPRDADHARTMLHRLSRSRHAVITGVALLRPDGRRYLTSDTTYVTMRPMTDAEIEDYIASGEWIGKAGAYAIQETADRFVTRVEGSFSNVVGLPIELVTRMLRRYAHLELPTDGA